LITRKKKEGKKKEEKVERVGIKAIVVTKKKLKHQVHPRSRSIGSDETRGHLAHRTQWVAATVCQIRAPD
jgi:hypothetical protein